SNAGHTIANDKGKVALNQVPSGIFYPNTTLYIGSGCVVNIEKLAAEIKSVQKLGIDLTKRLKISSLASIVQPHHVLLDGLMGGSVGTLKHGIGPAYADRAMRMYGDRLVNIRLADLVDDPKHFFSAIEINLKETESNYKIKNSGTNQTIELIKKAFEEIKAFIELDPLYMEKRAEKGARILFEGAQSVMLDIVKGSVPYVTSSSTIAAGAYSGGDLSPKHHRKTIGVVKAIMSRVGHGPFPSEFGGKKSEEYTMAKMNGESKYTRDSETKYDINKLIMSDDPFDVGTALRILSGEYGTVTKRPRRVGCLDLVLLSHTAKLNCVDELFITKCDLLNEYSRTKKKTMPFVTGYKLDGKTLDYVPGATSAFYRVTPVITEKKASSENISEVRTFAELPKEIKDFVREVETASGCKVIGLGVGPKRDQYIALP